MKAIVQSEYGSADVLSLAEVAMPATPGLLPVQSVLVRIQAAAVHAGDGHLMRGTPYLIRLIFGGLRKPKIKILGCDLAGEVVAVGPEVRQFQPGDHVFGDVSEAGFGAFAEYVCAPERTFAPKPSNISFSAAATVPVSAQTALQGLRDVGKLQAGQTVLIRGATGGVGSFAVQIAKAWGATVSAACRPAKADMVRNLGADTIVTTDPKMLPKAAYDLILDMAAYDSALAYLPALKPGGQYVWVGGKLSLLFQVMLLGGLVSKLTGKKLHSLTCKPNQTDLLTLKQMIEAGQITPYVDRQFSLAEVPDAIRYLEGRQVQGKVAIQIGEATTIH